MQTSSRTIEQIATPFIRTLRHERQASSQVRALASKAGVGPTCRSTRTPEMPVHFVVAGSRAPFSWTLDRNIDVHTTMKIGKFVQQHISAIFNYCDNVAHEEIARLLDPEYSKDIFGIHFPFCAQVENMTDKDSVRYWVRIYRVRGKQVRVTSQWFDYNFSKFESYLGSKHIALSSQPRTQTGNEDVSGIMGSGLALTHLA